MRTCTLLATLLVTWLALAAPSPTLAGPVELVSRVAPGMESVTAAGQSFISPGSLSADGRYLVFSSSARNLVPGQGGPPNFSDVFLYDRSTGTTTLVSHRPDAPALAANGWSSNAQISPDGRYVVFISQATNLVPGQQDLNIGFGTSGNDVFLFDRLSGANVLVSHTPPSAVQAGSSESF